MPYDKYDRWIPPKDGWNTGAEMGQGDGFNWIDHWDYDDIIQHITDGRWEELDIGSLDDLANLYQTPEWGELDNRKRVEAIQEFQDKYHGDSSNFPWNESDRASEEWGLDIRRTSDQDGGMATNWDGAYTWFEEMGSSSIYPSDSTIDWASYNDDNLYDAARKSMVENHSDIFGDNYMNKYDTINEVRTAQSIINNWSEQERTEALDWASKNVTPNKKDNEDAQEYFPTRKFDTETNTTTYYEHLTGEATGESKQWLPPDPPKDLRIVTGNKPTPTYDSDGNQVVTEADITHLYHQYLDRAPAQEGLDYWMNSGNSLAEIESNIKLTDEGQTAKAKGLWSSQVYYNPQEYGSPESLTAKMKTAPPKISAPSITIRNIGEPKKPTRHYMALNDTVWTDPSVDTRSTKWDASQGKRVSTGKPRKDAAFPTEAPIKGGT